MTKKLTEAERAERKELDDRMNRLDKALDTAVDAWFETTQTAGPFADLYVQTLDQETLRLIAADALINHFAGLPEADA